MIGLSPALAWLGGGLLLMLAEVLLPGVYLLWIGLAAFGTGVAVLLGLSGWAAQVICFGMLSALSILVGLRYSRPPVRRINTPESGLMGRTAEARAFTGSEGRVHVGDTDWPAELVGGGAAPAPGTRLRIVGVRGTVLLVQPPDA